MELLLAATRELQGADGCELYVVSQDRDNPDKIWVFEAWRDEATHRASLDMPEVRGVIERGLPLIAERPRPSSWSSRRPRSCWKAATAVW